MFKKFLSFSLGFVSIICQIVFLRELITIFYGNETTYAIILASWLFWVATGSYSSSFIIKRIKSPEKIVTLLSILIYICAPLTLIVSRIVRDIIGVSPGEMISIAQMWDVSFLLLAPLAILLGAMYSIICHVSAKQRESAEVGISNVYFWESKGAAIGGILFSFFLVKYIPALMIIVIVTTLNLVLILKGNWTSGRFSKAVLISFIAFSIVAITSGRLMKLDKYSKRIQWNGFEVVDSVDSIYGNITITKSEDGYSIFENGVLSLTTDDESEGEESVHFAMLEHKAPRDVLLIGGGLSGSIREILKYRGARVDYVELDPKVIELSKIYFSREHVSVLGDKRVEVIYKDARLFVKQTNKKYDVIIVNLGDPVTALINRYYTVGFFREARRILRHEGVISCRVSSSENYLSDETVLLLRSINSTLKDVFDDVISIPGDSQTFIASKARTVLRLSSHMLVARLRERGIQTKYINEHYLPFRLSKDRIMQSQELLKRSGSINFDSRPITYLYNIILWSTHFSGGLSSFFKAVRWIELKHLLLLPLLTLVGGFFFQKKNKDFSIGLSIATTGFSEIIFQIIVIIAFQSLYGYAYYKIGFIISSFMVGLSVGCLFARRIIKLVPQKINSIYREVQLSICIYPLLLPILFIIFRNFSVIQNRPEIFSTVFAALPIIAGFIGGAQYPLAVYILSKQDGSKNIAGVAGWLYAIDVGGASIGAILAAVILIPLLGITSVAIFCAALNFSVFILLCKNK